MENVMTKMPSIKHAPNVDVGELSEPLTYSEEPHLSEEYALA